MARSEYQEWRRRRIDRAIGIALGLVLGIAVVIVFVFYGSDDTIDAPSLGEDDRPAIERQGRGEDGR